MWQIGHTAGRCRPLRNRVAVAAQLQGWDVGKGVVGACQLRFALSGSGGGAVRVIGRRRWGWTFAFAALSIVSSANYFGTSARAQAQRSDEPPEPAQSTLTGDWGGLRPSLERKGLVFTLNYTNGIGSTLAIGLSYPANRLPMMTNLGGAELSV